MKRALRIIGIFIGVIIVLVVVVFGLVIFQSEAKLNQTWDNIDVADIDTLSVTAEQLLEGERLFVARGCASCHGDDGRGTLFFDDVAIGYLPASNLTSGDGGIGQTYTTDDYVRAIQHGLRPDGTSLLVMPSQDLQQMREEELTALVAYTQSLDPVDNILPDREIRTLGRVLLLIGEIPLTAELVDHENAGLVTVDFGATIEYGEYLAATCMGCHGDNFGGGIALEPGAPPSANITFHPDGIASWTLADFSTAIRTGITPGGDELDSSMPWQSFSALTDDEIEALYVYLQTVEPVGGN